MENRDYREEIGKKLEEAMELGDFAELEDLIEMPSPETFAKWVDQGQERYNKRTRRKRILATCAILVVVCISALIAIKCIAPPEVEAGPEGRIGIDITDMESTATYDSWNDLPSDIKDQFIEIRDLPDGYEVEKIEVFTGNRIEKMIFYLKNGEISFEIRESVYLSGTLPVTVVDEANMIDKIKGAPVYVELNKDALDTTTYKFVVNNILLDVVVSNSVDRSDIVKILGAI